MNVESCCRSSNGEWRSCADLGGDGGGDNQSGRGVGESRVKKVKHDEKESSIETKDKKRKSEGESVSKLKKENEELKEKLKKQGRAADKMAEEYSRLRGRLRKFKRERADLEAQIEVLKQRNKDLSTMAGSEEISQNTVKEADREMEQKSPTNEEKETNCNVKEEHHEKSLMAEVLKLKVVYFVLGHFFMILFLAWFLSFLCHHFLYFGLKIDLKYAISTINSTGLSEESVWGWRG